MKPWQSVEKQTFECKQCGCTFAAKRTAKFCSALCQNRSRARSPAPKEKVKEWRAARLEKPGYRERVNAVANERATGIRRWLDAFKIAAGCVDCGYRAHPHALHFDHLGDKVLNVSYAESLRQAKAEISKCEVRCANCHSIKTHERRQAHKSA